MSAAPGPVIGQGRASVIYDLGDGTVLRRCRNSSASTESEAAAMRLAAAGGVPVPRVHTASGPDIVMDLVPGPTMLETLLTEPARAIDAGRALADLHDLLDGVRRGDDPGTLVHGDLHPGNVVLSARGPVLLDWTNHRWGERAVDRALTWLILACFDPGPEAAAVDDVRGELLEAYLAAIDRREAAASLEAAAAIRAADPGTTEVEQQEMADLVARHRG